MSRKKRMLSILPNLDSSKTDYLTSGALGRENNVPRRKKVPSVSDSPNQPVKSDRDCCRLLTDPSCNSGCILNQLPFLQYGSVNLIYKQLLVHIFWWGNYRVYWIYKIAVLARFLFLISTPLSIFLVPRALNGANIRYSYLPNIQLRTLVSSIIHTGPIYNFELWFPPPFILALYKTELWLPPLFKTCSSSINSEL